MDKEVKSDTENENLHDMKQGDVSGNDSLSNDRSSEGEYEGAITTNEDGNNDDTDKYLALEQPGVTYTDDTEPSNLSDQLDYRNNNMQNKWEAGTDNGTYSDAFNQDGYILNDNIDLDEDQNQSISSDDEDFEETNERYTN